MKQQQKEKPEAVITRLLPVPLTEEEELKLGQSLADLKLSVNKLEIEKSVKMKEYGNKIKGMENSLSELSEQLKNRTKNATVNCTWKPNDPKAGLKSLYRDDTKERLETYPMNLLDTDTEADDFVPEKKKKEKEEVKKDSKK